MPNWSKEQLQRPTQWAEEYGLGQFAPGGQYAPENIMALLGPILAQQGQYQAQQVGAPSLTELQRYGMGAMGLAGRAGAVQAGHAATGLGGLNPAARAAAMAQISQAAGANVGQAGVQGMLQGGDWLQRASLANQQANLATQQMSLQDLMQRRGIQGSMLGQAMGTSAQVGMGRLGQMANWRLALQQMTEAENARRAAEQGSFWDTLGGLGGAIGTIGGTLLGGPLGGAIGSGLSGLFGGGAPQTTGFTQTPQMPGYPQGPLGQSVKPHYPQFRRG